MLSILTVRWAEAYASPRLSARRILTSAPSVAEALLLAAAAFALLEVLRRMMEMGLAVNMIEVLATMSTTSAEEIARRVEASKSFSFVASGFGWHMLETIVAAYLAWRLGALAGGGANFRQLLGLAGWWTLASVPLTALSQLVLFLSASNAAPLGLVAMLVAALYIFYMLAAFVTEAHGFESEGSVFIAMLGVVFALATIALIFNR